MSRLNFTEATDRRPQRAAGISGFEIFLMAVVGAICALIVAWPHA